VLADAIEQAGHALILIGESLARLLKPGSPRRATKRLIDQFYVQAVKSLLVVTVVAVFTGMVLSLQIGEELRRYGLEDQIGKVVAASLAREMGPFITAIILTATVGGAIAAELGTMRVGEEIDALELMDIDPVAFLVTPRVVALTVTAILLTVWVDFVAITGGAIVATSQYGLRWGDYFDSARQTMATQELFGVSKDVYSGLVKAGVFGFLIAGIGCASGMRAKGGALGVGRAVRRAVVASVVVVLIVGYIITWIFWA
jgi:phospholipid/cholesterol/gamma-HCH transport system permease protein